jgi:hypothetical protein
VTGRIVGYDPAKGEILIRAAYPDWETLTRRQYNECVVFVADERPLSNDQRKWCWALLTEIADWQGNYVEITKQEMTNLFQAEKPDGEPVSLSTSSMSRVKEFQSFLVDFVVEQGVPCKRPLTELVDDMSAFIYSCVMHKKCCISGRDAELHHIDRVGMGRDRTDIIHIGMEVLPLTREYHTEAHTMPDKTFFANYHLNGGVLVDQKIAEIYNLGVKEK